AVPAAAAAAAAPELLAQRRRLLLELLDARLEARLRVALERREPPGQRVDLALDGGELAVELLVGRRRLRVVVGRPEAGLLLLAGRVRVLVDALVALVLLLLGARHGRSVSSSLIGRRRAPPGGHGPTTRTPRSTSGPSAASVIAVPSTTSSSRRSRSL